MMNGFWYPYPAPAMLPLKNRTAAVVHIISGEDDVAGAQFQHAKIFGGGGGLGLGGSGRDENCGEGNQAEGKKAKIRT